MPQLLTKGELYKLQQAWLRLFEGTEVHWLLNTEIKDPALRSKERFEGVFYTQQDAFERNFTTPVSHCYTPNGNFAAVNKGARTGDKSNRKEVDAEENYFVFMLDLDKKSLAHPDAPDYSREDLLEIMKRERFPVQYITETPGGWHLYMFIDKQDRLSVKKKVYADIQTALAEVFGADNLKDTARLMRVPFSTYWKGGTNQGHVPLYKVDPLPNGEFELEEVTSPDQITINEYQVFTLEQIQQLHDSITEKVVVNTSPVEDKLFDKVGGASDYVTKCNNIKMTKIIEALSYGYQRWNEKIEMYEYPVVFDGTRIALQRITPDGEMGDIDHTSGFRIKLSENYVSNLSLPKRTKQERPVGPPYAFVFHWFQGNSIKLFNFFEKEFGFQRRTTQSDLYMTINGSRGPIDFDKNGVTYTVTTVQQSKTSTRNVRLMHTGCYPKAIIKTKWNTAKSETDKENKYILLCTKRGEDVLIAYYTDKKAFNRVHGSHGMQFIGDEVSMNDWYEAIWEAGEMGDIPTYQYYGTNGFYEDGFLYGKTWISPDGKDKQVSEIRGKYFGNPLVHTAYNNKAQVSIDEYYQDLTTLFPERISVVAFLAYISGMCGIHFWAPVSEKINSTSIIPSLFLSGITQSGKSTLSFLMKEGFGLNSNERIKAINSTTAQPLKQLSTDNVVLHITEFTGIVATAKEDAIRDIINKNVGERGNADASNSAYIFRANIMIEGERLPDSESLTNRNIIVPFFKSDKKGTNDQIIELRNKTFIFDLVKKIYANWNNVEKYYLEGLKVLGATGLSARELQLYTYIYVINKVLNMVSTEQLISAIQENNTIVNSFEKPDSLDEMLSEIIFVERIRPVMYESFPDNGHAYLSVPIPAHIISRNRIKLAECLKEYAGGLAIQNSCLILRKNKIDLITRKIEKFSQGATHRDTSMG